MNCVVVVIGVVFIIVLICSLTLIFRKRKCEPKTKGGGVIIEGKKTKFKITDNILPVIEPNKLLNNPIVVKYISSYKKIITKELTDDNIKDVVKDFKVWSKAVCLYNKFMAIQKNNINNDTKRLRDLYCKMSGIEFLKNEIEIRNRLNDEHIEDNFEEVYKDFNKNRDKLFEKLPDKDKVKELFDKIHGNEKRTKTEIDELYNLLNSNIEPIVKPVREKFRDNISSEDFDENFMNEYLKILNYGDKANFIVNYISDFIDLFSSGSKVIDVDFVYNCSVCQEVYEDGKNKHPYQISLDASLENIFKKDPTIRYWYNNELLKDISTDIKVDGYTGEAKDHADVVPASVVNAYTQILILLYVHRNMKDENKLFKFLLATRLNMSFINILANVTEQNTYNKAVSNSFFTES